MRPPSGHTGGAPARGPPGICGGSQRQRSLFPVSPHLIFDPNTGMNTPSFTTYILGVPARYSLQITRVKQYPALSNSKSTIVSKLWYAMYVSKHCQTTGLMTSRLGVMSPCSRERIYTALRLAAAAGYTASAFTLFRNTSRTSKQY